MLRLFIVYLGLITLTLLGAYISTMGVTAAWIPIAIVMALAAVKFITVAMEYMEVRKANRAWKIVSVVPVAIIAFIIAVFTIA